MKANEMLRGAFGQAHGILDGQLADCSPAVMSKQYAGGTIHPIGSIYAHVMYSEDNIINGLMQGKPPIWQAAGWSAKTGTTLPQAANQTDEWAGLNIDLEVQGLRHGDQAEHGCLPRRPFRGRPRTQDHLLRPGDARRRRPG
jgi:hypothetical protein